MRIRDLSSDGCSSDLPERVVKLAGEEGGWANGRDLHAGHRGDEGGGQGHLGLAEANVAADEAVHRAAGTQIADDLADGAVLVVGLLIGEAIDEGGVAGVGLGDSAGTQGALGRRLDELARDLADALLHPRLATLPGFAAQLVERDAVALAAITGEDVDILDRHVELVAARIRKGDTVVRRLLHRDLSQALITPDTVIGVHHEIAGRERGEFTDEGVGALLALAAAYEAVAEHVLLGE